MSICMRCGGDCTCHRHGRADEELFYVCCEGLKYPPDHKGHCMERIREVLDKVQQPTPKSDECGDGELETCRCINSQRYLKLKNASIGEIYELKNESNFDADDDFDKLLDALTPYQEIAK